MKPYDLQTNAACLARGWPEFLEPDNQGGAQITQQWKDAFTFKVVHPDYGKHEYCPTAKGLEFHTDQRTNCLIEGSRGTGKSMIIRNDAHLRALAYPGYTYLIVRRTMPELKKSHLKSNLLPAEMRKFGGTYHKTDFIATYHNGSQGFFAHCETEDDMLKLLSSEYCAIYFDEISTFTWTMVAKIASCLRVPEGSGLTAIMRAGTNPIGVGAADCNRYFRTKDVNPEDDPDYDPSEWHSIHTTLDDNPYIDRAQYIKRLGASGLPEHIRRAWLDGEWIIEGAYFHDYRPTRSINGMATPWHVIDSIPVIKSKEGLKEAHEHRWIRIYRAIDWGFSPDPCVCLWIAVLPNGRALVLKERHWKSKPAKTVAEDIIRESSGMNIVETYCDPSMFYGSQATEHRSVGDIFEDNGVQLTQSKNDRAQAGYAIHEFLNTICDDDGLPQIQIYSFGCPNLVRTLPEQRVDKNHPERIADGNDHWVISLAYFCMGRVGRSFEDTQDALPYWMRPKAGKGRGRFGISLGSESVRTHYR